MLSLFGFGFLLGMQHALEADHIAAVASLTNCETSSKRVVTHGMAWGVGHTMALLIFGGVILIFGIQVHALGMQWLEVAVGAMLVGLGAKVLYSLLREKIHIHAHRHDDGLVHIHAHGHSHSYYIDHQQRSAHDHTHGRHGNGRYVQTIIVGIMHGMAGTAALLVFVATAFIETVFQAIVYLAIFGAGSILGMALLSAVLVIPTSCAVKSLPRFDLVFRFSTGSLTAMIGGYLMVTNWVF